MPGNGFTFAIRIGCENDAIAVFQRFDNIGKAFGGIAIHLPRHCKVFVGTNRAILGWQVPHMTERGQNLIVRAQIFIDGFSLGRRFDNDDVHLKQPRFAPHGDKIPPLRVKFVAFT